MEASVNLDTLPGTLLMLNFFPDTASFLPLLPVLVLEDVILERFFLEEEDEVPRLPLDVFSFRFAFPLGFFLFVFFFVITLDTVDLEDIRLEVYSFFFLLPPCVDFFRLMFV